MFRKIVVALTATAALSAAILVPTTSSAYPIPRPHMGHGSPGGVGFVGLPYLPGLPALPGFVLVCSRHFYGYGGWHNADCRWMPRPRAGR